MCLAACSNASELLEKAKALEQAKDYCHAQEIYLKILQNDQYNMAARFSLGLIYIHLNELVLAHECFATLYQQFPNEIPIQYNLAYVARRMGKYEQAIQIYCKLIKNDPDNSSIHFGMANAYLTLQDFNNGLHFYEKARKSAAIVHPQLKDMPNLNNKIILIIEEWGFGDTFHFVRYAKELKAKGATVWITARQETHGLLKNCPFIDQVFDINDQSCYLKADFQIPMISLMYVCNTTFDTIQAQIPYLYANPQLIQFWRKQVKKNHFNVGVNWKGTAEKNMNPNLFFPLADIPKVHLYSIQKFNQELSEQKNNPIIFFPDFDETHGNFMDTAALIKSLDLVITTDTSIAHIAGALGAPTWLLIPCWADWRWFWNRNDSPWYPTMRIFRQPKPGDWESVIEEVKIELKKIVRNYEKNIV